MKSGSKNKAVFLDRDGIFNQAPEVFGLTHITSTQDLKLIVGIDLLVRKINDAEMLAIMISNQSCIERGTLTLAGLNEITHSVHTHLAAAGAVLDGVYYCSHLQESNCLCRKPKPGMLREAAKKYNIDLKNSYMVGDRWFDVEAGKAAGCKTIFLADGERNKIDLTKCDPDYIVKSFDEIFKIINL